jgi:hypothetical protein
LELAQAIERQGGTVAIPAVERKAP